MKQKKHTQIQRILRLENIVAQMYVKLEALKLIIDNENKEINLEKNKGKVDKPSGDKQNKKQG